MNSGNLYTPFCVTASFAVGALIGLLAGEIHTFHKITVLLLATTAFHFAHTYSRKH